MPISVTLAGRTFTSKQAFIEHCRAILHRDAFDTEIAGEDARFVAAILLRRPDKVAECRGRRVVQYLRKMHRHSTPCFFAELDDGALVDLSFMKFINAFPEPACGGLLSEVAQPSG